MVTAVFVMAVLNLGLGFLLANVLECPWQLTFPTLNQRQRPPLPGQLTESVSVTPEDQGVLRDEWISLIRQAKLEPASAIESILWLVYFDVPILRACLLPVDQRWWSTQGEELLEDTFADETAILLEKLEQWAAVLHHHHDHQPLGRLAAEFEELLLDQQFQAKSARDSLLGMTEKEDSKLQIPHELATVFNASDVVRDFAARELARLLRNEGRLEPIDELRQKDVASGLLSRLGLEVLLHDWWAEDPERVRLASCVLVDVDRTAKLNESLGAHATDRLLAAFGELIGDLVRKERGLDRVVRYDGQSFLLFLGDTAIANAASGAERIRQSFEVSSFEVGQQAVELTASLGVAEIGRRESAEPFLQRLEATMRESKNAGRDRTFADEGSGPAPVKVAQYQVERREIRVELE